MLGMAIERLARTARLGLNKRLRHSAGSRFRSRPRFLQ